MKFSERTKRLLEWWTLHIGSTKNKSEDTKENVERINTPATSNTSVSVGNDTMGREG
jgi:hypothetical protein